MKITLTVFANCNSGSATMALFKDGAANAVAAAPIVADASGAHTNSMVFIEAAGGTSEITYTVRAGDNSGGTVTVNGTVGNQWYNGKAVSSIVIEEIKV